MPRRKNITNQVFDRLTAIKVVGTNKNNACIWECKCSCGNIVKVITRNLIIGSTRSCGCLQKESVKKSLTTHGHSKNALATSEYTTWKNMKKRCYDKSSSMYYLYGGKGIIMCDRWLYSFENFLKDMGLKPSKEYSIDRFPNKNGNYEPSNCRWATPIEQANNKNSNRLIIINGQAKSIATWAKELGISRYKVQNYDQFSGSIQVPGG